MRVRSERCVRVVSVCLGGGVPRVCLCPCPMPVLSPEGRGNLAPGFPLRGLGWWGRAGRNLSLQFLSLLNSESRMWNTSLKCF